MQHSPGYRVNGCAMLKAIKELLVGTRETQEKYTAQSLITAGPAGYFKPATAEQLLNTVPRRKCLQQLWENSALPKDLYEQFYLQPLKYLISLMQVLPAAQQGEYAKEGGLVDVTLQTTTFTVRLAKGHMLPPGAAPEEQSAQNVRWNAVVFYAALCQYLPLFNLLEGELQSGRAWLPGLTVPSEPYRFRFKINPPDSTLSTSQSAIIAAHLLPADAIDWLSTLPAAARALLLIAARQQSPFPVIDDIVQEAVRLARGESLSLALPTVLMANVSQMPVSTPSPLQDGTAATGPLIPAVEIEFEQVSGADVLLSSALDAPVSDKPPAERVVASETIIAVEEDMQTLLSLMAMEMSVPECPENENQKLQEVVANADVSESGGFVQPVKPALIPEVNGVIGLAANAVITMAEKTAPDEEVKTADTVRAGGSSASCQTIVEAKEIERSGEEFWRWLSAGLISGEIPVNTSEARVHIVSGFVFITIPGVFYLYLKQAGLGGDHREDLQEDFERLEKHRRAKGKRFYYSHLYESSARSGSFKRTKGYLIKASLLYRGERVPDDSLVLVIP